MKVGDRVRPFVPSHLVEPHSVWKITAVKGNEVELQGPSGERIVRSKMWVRYWSVAA